MSYLDQLRQEAARVEKESFYIPHVWYGEGKLLIVMLDDAWLRRKVNHRVGTFKLSHLMVCGYVQISAENKILEADILEEDVDREDFFPLQFQETKWDNVVEPEVEKGTRFMMLSGHKKVSYVVKTARAGKKIGDTAQVHQYTMVFGDDKSPLANEFWKAFPA